MKFIVVGIPNNIPTFSNRIKSIIAANTVFSGGKRHLGLVRQFLPEKHRWITVQAPMESLYRAYEHCEEPIVVFASGNPLFYGMASTLLKKYPNAVMEVFPHFSAVQVLAHKTNTTCNNLEVVSVHGRPWKELDVALLQQKELFGVLTDQKNTPAMLAKRMLAYGYDNYRVILGEDLESEQEKITEFSLADLCNYKASTLNCILLRQLTKRKQFFGIRDSEFKGLPGRPNMISKMPVRLTSLHFLDVCNKTVLWDIGFCTGSVSIEAKLKHPHLKVIAFEKRMECEEIMKENMKKFGVPDIEMIMGDFFLANIAELPVPDTIFIGGHGGRLNELMTALERLVPSGTTFVINAVKEESKKQFIKSCNFLGLTQKGSTELTVDAHNTIRILSAEK